MSLSLAPTQPETADPRLQIHPSEGLLQIAVDFENGDLEKPRFPGLIRYRNERGEVLLPKGVEACLAFAAFEQKEDRELRFELMIANRDISFRRIGSAPPALIRFIDPGDLSQARPAPEAFLGAEVDRQDRRCTLGWRFKAGDPSFAAYFFLELQDRAGRIGFLPMAMALISDSTEDRVSALPTGGPSELWSASESGSSDSGFVGSGARPAEDSRLSIDVELRGSRPVFSMFNYALIPEDLLAQPAFLVHGRDELALELRCIDGNRFEPAAPKSFEAQIGFLDEDLELIKAPREFLASRLADENRRCRTFWRFDTETGEEKTLSKNSFGISSFFLATTPPPGSAGQRGGRRAWIDPTVIQPRPVGGGGQ